MPAGRTSHDISRPGQQAIAPIDAEVQRKMDQALDLRIGYASYSQIAAVMGCSKKTAFKWVQRGLKQLVERNLESAERVRVMELARLDALSLKVAAGKTLPRVADTLVRIADRRARLLGLDAPVKIAGPTGGAIPILNASVELTEDERRERARDYLLGGGQRMLPAQVEPIEPPAGDP